MDVFEASTATEEEIRSENVQSDDTTEDETEQNAFIDDNGSGEDIGRRNTESGHETKINGKRI